MNRRMEKKYHWLYIDGSTKKKFLFGINAMFALNKKIINEE